MVRGRYKKALYAMPAAPQSSLSLNVPGSVSEGQRFTATATVSVPAGKPAAKSVTAALKAPAGWKISPRSTPIKIAKIRGGTSGTFSWTVTAPAGTVPKVNVLTATAHLVQADQSKAPRDERIIGSIPAKPPAGHNQVSDLPFFSATNGWGR